MPSITQKRRAFLGVLCFVLSISPILKPAASLHAQAEDIPALKEKLNEEISDSLRYATFRNLSRAYIYKSTDSSKLYTDSMKFLAIAMGDKVLEMKAEFNYSVVLRQQGQTAEALVKIREYDQFIAQSTDTLDIIKTKYQLGATLLTLDSTGKSIEVLLQALALAETAGLEKQAGQVANAVAVNFKSIGQEEKALEYFEKSAAVFEKSGDNMSRAIAYNGIGIIYRNRDSLALAKQYFSDALGWFRESDNKKGEAYQLRNLGNLAYVEGDLKEAENYYLQALPIREKLQDKKGVGGSYYDLGALYREMGEFEKGERYLLRSTEVFEEMQFKSSLNTSHWELAQLYEQKGDYQKALQFERLYQTVQDSLASNDLRERVYELEVQYESEKKDKYLAEKDLALEKEQRKNFTYLGVAAILLVLAGLFAWLYRLARRKKQQELLAMKRSYQVQSLEALLEGEEKERQRIAKELHDGVNGDLSAIKYKLSSLAQSNQTAIAEAIAMVDQSCEQVRAISHNLTPPSLENFSLAESLVNYCQNLNEMHALVEISFQQIGNDPLLDKKDEISLFRIVQELVSNSLKHADPQEITVQLSCHDQQLHLTVEDDGSGFDTKEVEQEGIGLQNIRSRVAYLNAQCEWESSANGTSFTLEMETAK